MTCCSRASSAWARSLTERSSARTSVLKVLKVRRSFDSLRSASLSTFSSSAWSSSSSSSAAALSGLSSSSAAAPSSSSPGFAAGFSSLSFGGSVSSVTSPRRRAFRPAMYAVLSSGAGAGAGAAVPSAGVSVGMVLLGDFSQLLLRSHRRRRRRGGRECAHRRSSSGRRRRRLLLRQQEGRLVGPGAKVLDALFGGVFVHRLEVAHHHQVEAHREVLAGIGRHVLAVEQQLLHLVDVLAVGVEIG